VVQEKLLQDKPAPEFKKVAISLHDILSGEFFTEYIKKGQKQTVFLEYGHKLTHGRKRFAALQRETRDRQCLCAAEWYAHHVLGQGDI
jgi:hypothetical protein